MLDDAAQREAMLRDLDEMQAMTRDTLAFLRGLESEEQARPVDLSALLEAVVEDACAAGGDVRLAGETGATLTARPLALERCLTNLVDNAIRYGGTMRVEVAEPAEQMVVSVLDAGTQQALGGHRGIPAHRTPHFALKGGANATRTALGPGRRCTPLLTRAGENGFPSIYGPAHPSRPLSAARAADSARPTAHRGGRGPGMLRPHAAGHAHGPWHARRRRAGRAARPRWRLPLRPAMR
jgi:hypothetical protein